MKKIIISASMLFNTFLYSQNQQFNRYKVFCEIEVFNMNKGGWIKSPIDTVCYGFFMNVNQDVFMIENYSDTTDVTFYNIYETHNEVFNWQYRSKDENGQNIYIKYTIDENYTMLRMDFSKGSIRYKSKVIQD
jgi:hypothetical protein